MTASPFEQTLQHGKTQWGKAWRAFACQWSQPKLMRLTQETLGTAAVHSSQIHGFTTGLLKHPAPKVLVAIGHLNAAIANAHGAEVDTPYKCPATKSDLWLGKHWLKDADGAPLDSAKVFLAYTGEIDLGFDEPWVFPDDAEEITRIERALGKELRMHLAQDSIDWFEEQFPESIHSLAMNEGCNTDLVAQNAAKIAEICHTDSKTLWEKVTHQI